MKAVSLVILSLVMLIVVGLGLDYFFGVTWYGFVGPKKEAVRREVFENTRSYNESKVQDLARYKLQYDQAESNTTKESIASYIQHSFANYPVDRLPAELRGFLRQVRGY